MRILSWIKSKIEKAQDGVMVALYLPESVAHGIALPGGEPPQDLHVTLAYFPGIGADPRKVSALVEALRSVAADFAPVAGAIGGLGRFNGSESSDHKDVFYGSYNAPGLPALREAVVKACEDAGFEVSRRHGFTPHVTLKYLNPSDPLPADKVATDDFRIPALSVASRRLGRTDLPLTGNRVLKSQPGMSSVHVPAPLGAEQEKPKVRKNDASSLAFGMDFEKAANDLDDDSAYELAASNLEADPDHYADLMGDDGLCLDLGSGPARQPGYVGVDLYPHDPATLIHDLNLGLPFEDGSVSRIRMANILDQVDDPQALMAEAQRVLAPGGTIEYEGEDELPADGYPGLTMTDFHSTAEADPDAVEKSGVVQQIFTRVDPSPDPATADDAYPDAPFADELIDAALSDPTDQSSTGDESVPTQKQGALHDGKTAESGARPGVGQSPAVSHGGQTQGAGTGAGVSGGVARPSHPAKAAAQARDSGSAGGASAGADQDAARAQAHGAGSAAAARFQGATPDDSQPGGRAGKQKKSGVLKSTDGERVLIWKSDPMKQILYCVVLTPDEVDSQEDWMPADEIEEAAHFYLENSRTVGSNHSNPINAVPVESYIAPIDIPFDGGPYGPQVVKQGSWVVGLKVRDPKEWQKVLNGDYQGVSVGGFGLRVPT